MNYLAHVFLSHQTPDAIVGAMLGDFVKGRSVEGWSAEVRAAILLHRAVDRYTDAHAIVRASRALVTPERRRFAGILVDVFYDHFLARHWVRYHDRPLPEFTRSVYTALLARRATFPERLQRILPRMAADDWLAAYAEVASVDLALNGIARRFRYAERARVLRTAVTELHDNYGRFEEHFREFLPQAHAFVAAHSLSESKTENGLSPVATE
jgi:acyl carrier protein phosphodiesterase